VYVPDEGTAVYSSYLYLSYTITITYKPILSFMDIPGKKVFDFFYFKSVDNTFTCCFSTNCSSTILTTISSSSLNISTGQYYYVCKFKVFPGIVTSPGTSSI
jgi:hypothetical protein